MSVDEALRFLQKHQPFPPDDQLSPATLDIFAAVVSYFRIHHDVRCVPLLLNCFGRGDCFGIYADIEHTITCYDAEYVLSPLKMALGSTNREVRYWCCQIAANFPDGSIESELVSNLDPTDFDLSFAALTALEQMSVITETRRLQEFAAQELPSELQALAGDVLQKFK